MKGRGFTSEFKGKVERILIIEDLSAKEVSEQLGVAENLLHRWKREHVDDLEASNPREVKV